MPASTSTSLLTDMYELTMLDAALKDGTAHRRCTFELFGRRLPATRRFGVVAGTGRILEALERFEFDAEQIDWLRDQGIISEEAAQFLASWRFTGDIWGYAEGECYFPGSPLLTVEGTFADCTLLETLLLSILNHDCAVASAASRMTIAAHGRPCMDMGARRAHERAAVSAARAAIIGGFQGTSDLEAAKRYGIRCIGTAAHAFTLLHDSERDAFDSQVAKLGAGTTLLVDTYDIRQGVINAVEAARAAGGELGAVRLDSGEPEADVERVIKILLQWIAEDRKATPLKALQGLIWKQGYEAGVLKGHVYPDAVAALKAWHEQGYDLYVYSSGSIQAQKLIFGCSEAGDLTLLFNGYFDTTSGPKREAQSYRHISEAIGCPAGKILFLSDIAEELDAAQEAGMQTCGLARDGGKKLGDHLTVSSFAEIDPTDI